jgi:hypothetical protein
MLPSFSQRCRGSATPTQRSLFFGLLLVLLAILFSPLSVSAQIFGYSSTEECFEKNQKKLRYPLANRLLVNSCFFGYEKELDKDLRKFRPSGKCIASRADSMYSYESTMTVINRCTQGSTEVFAVFRGYLNRAIEDAQEVSRPRAIPPRVLMPEQNNTFTIFDSQTGTMKICNQIGTIVNCF